MRLRFTIAAALATVLLLAGCRRDEMMVLAEETPVGEALQPRPDAVPRGMYLLNEGNMGSNKATIDYLDYRAGTYTRNLYAERNPGVVMELGDVGNHIAVNQGRVYAVVNCSHKVEVMDAYTLQRIGQVDIANCRYIAFDDAGQAYVSSYVGPVQLDPSAPRGEVVRFDTSTLRITGRVTVGYQPEQIAIAGGWLFVANSGGYRAPNYDTTLSCIRLSDFRQTALIEVGANPGPVMADSQGRIWVGSRGDYAGVKPSLTVLAPTGSATSAPLEAVASFDNTPVSVMAERDGIVYYIAGSFNSQNGATTSRFGMIDAATLQPLPGSFITDGSESSIKVAYGLALHPTDGTIFVTDAKNYVSSGTLRCYSAQGQLLWSVATGDIPSSMAFVP